MTVRPSFLLRVAALLLACLASVGAGESPQSFRDGRFVDADFAFSLDVDTDEWTVMDQAEVQRLAPDAVMGVVRSGEGALAVVIVERVPGADLDTYTDFLMQRIEPHHPELVERRMIWTDSLQMLRTRAKLTVRGFPMEYVWHVARRGDFFYQIVGWSAEQLFPQTLPRIEALVEGFHFLMDRDPRTRDLGGPVRELEGYDWRLRGGVYENASFGVRLAPGEGWRPLVGGELTAMNADAFVGLQFNGPGLYQVHIAEPAAPAIRADLDRYFAATYSEDAGYREFARETVDVAGRPAESRVLQTRFGSTEGVLVVTRFYDERLSYQIVSWWIGPPDPETLARVAESYAFVELLDAEARAGLRAALLADDPTNCMGEGYALRRGLFTDYARGFTFRVPPGLWRAVAGDEADVEEPGVRLLLENPAAGLFVRVYADREAFTSHYEMHRDAQREFDPDGAALVDTLPGPGERYRTRLEMEAGGLDFDYALETTGREDGRCVRVLVYGLSSNMAAAGELADAVFGCLSLPDTLPEPREQDGLSLTDLRAGFRVEPPGPGWSFFDLDGVWPATGAYAALSRGDDQAVLFSIQVPEADDDLLADLALDALGVQRVIGEAVAEETVEWGGRPCRRVVLEGRKGLGKVGVVAWQVRRGNTLHLLLTVSQLGVFAPDDALERARPLRDCVTWLD